MHQDWKDTDGSVASVEEHQTRYGKNYSVVFTYKVENEWYGGTFTSEEPYSKDDTLTVLYDPARPERNNLVEHERIRHWILGAVILIAALLLLFAAMH